MQLPQPAREVAEAFALVLCNRALPWLNSRPVRVMSTAELAATLVRNSVSPADGRELVQLAASGAFDVLVGGTFARVQRGV